MTHKQTIVVIEDETLLLQAITKKLELSNFDVIACSGGQQALDYLKQSITPPAAIWMDFYLKDSNGLELMREIKTNPSWSHIPVIVVSNSASSEKVHNMLALGARKYILKAEYRLDEIIAIIKQLINETELIQPEDQSTSQK